MCSIVILSRPQHEWPILIGANRDETAGRPWALPGRHWPDRPEIRAGRDELAGGSWLGLNDHGVVAAVMNRIGTLGPAAGKRSRGELVLEALDHADARAAAGALVDLDPAAYRPFNLVIADNRDAYWLRNLGRADTAIWLERLPAGLSMITAHDRNDRAQSRRIAHFLPLFQAARPPDPDRGDWSDWEKLLATTDPAPGGSLYDAMTILGEDGFQTLSSALIGLPSVDSSKRAIWRFAAGRPDRNSFEIVSA